MARGRCSPAATDPDVLADARVAYLSDEKPPALRILDPANGSESTIDLVHGVSFDPLTLGIAAGVTVAAGILAALIPAGRAASADPAHVLRAW